MSVEGRDFSNFWLGDNVYGLAGGLIPEIAERLEVDPGEVPSSAALQAIMDKVGTNKVLRENEEVTVFSRSEMADLVARSGVQKPLRRSLWSPDITLTPNKQYRNVDAVVIVGGMANWQDRTAALVEDLPSYLPIHSLAGSRTMNTETERPNPNVDNLLKKFGRYPVESEYAASVIVPRLVNGGREVLATSYDTQNGDTIFDRFFEQNPRLLHRRLILARVANAGIVMAVQMREAALRVRDDFDSDSLRPQVFVATDSFPVSRSERGDKAPSRYQKAASALRQVVLTAKKLHETTGGQ